MAVLIHDFRSILEARLLMIMSPKNIATQYLKVGLDDQWDFPSHGLSFNFWNLREGNL